MVLIGRHSDQTDERKWHVVACGLTAGTGLVLATLFRDRVPLIVLSFTFSQVGQRAFQGVFWAIPPMFLGGSAAAAGIAVINAIGNLGGAVGPSLVGWLRKGSDDYSSGLLVLASGLFLQAVLVALLRLPDRRPRSGDTYLPLAPATQDSTSSSFRGIADESSR